MTKSTGLTKILADDLENNQFSSLVEFMKSAFEGTLARRGKRVDITGLTRKRVKFLLQKFLTPTAYPSMGSSIPQVSSR